MCGGLGLPNHQPDLQHRRESLGVEVETVWQPIDSLQVLFNYAYLDAKLKDPGWVLPGRARRSRSVRVRA